MRQHNLPLHPVQAGAGDDQGVGRVGGERLQRAARPADVRVVAARVRLTGGDHRRRDVDGVHLLDQRCEAPGNVAGAAAGVEDARRGAGGEQADEGGDRRGRVGRPVAVGRGHARLGEDAAVLRPPLGRLGLGAPVAEGGAQPQELIGRAPRCVERRLPARGVAQVEPAEGADRGLAVVVNLGLAAEAGLAGDDVQR